MTEQEEHALSVGLAVGFFGAAAIAFSLWVGTWETETDRALDRLERFTDRLELKSCLDRAEDAGDRYLCLTAE